MHDTGDVLYRISGATMLASGMFNAIWALMMTAGLIWFCIGIFWLIPLVLSFLQIGLGLVMIVVGRQAQPLGFAPIIGVVTSALNMNFMFITLDVISLALGIGGFVVASQRALEDREF